MIYAGSCLPPGVGAESGAVRGWVGGSGAVPGASVRPLCLLLVNCHLPIDLTGRSDFRRALNQRIRGHCDARRRVGEAGRAIGTKSRVLGGHLGPSQTRKEVRCQLTMELPATIICFSKTWFFDRVSGDVQSTTRAHLDLID